jgi:crotonobetainyl-CoA:carnitine CoA-transferase CaiB-like acyl-CoA transferase
VEDNALKELRVVEIGDRIAVGACGSLLAALGAETILIEPGEARRSHKWIDRAIVAAGKRSVVGAADEALVASLLATADVVLASSDLAPLPAYDRPPGQIRCDITAYGGSGPLAPLPHPDFLVQAVTGLADTTGEPGSAPTPIGFPVTEGIAGLYAAAGVLAALRARARHGLGQDVEVALYDCAFSTLTTFLPFHMIGKPVTRSGNRHALAAPWNVYQAGDGWLVLCTGTDDQWKRLCKAMALAELAADPRFERVGDRAQHCAAIDAAVQGWVARRSVAECAAILQQADIPCGPIVTVEDLASEPNLGHRQAVSLHPDPDSGRATRVPGCVVKTTIHPLPPPLGIPARDEYRRSAATPRRAITAAGDNRREPGPERPFAGLKVLEIGQFTTAPLIARQLAALGADVLKIEPPTGDASRRWPPQQGGQGYFFTFSNSDKRSLTLDLGEDADRRVFQALVAKADVLVENLKPGALARLGLGAAALAAINPRLVYCAVSGFGADSLYPGRPAFDTVVQAMSGLMDLTRVEGVPQKTGISVADIVGGLFGLAAIMSALATRDATGRGEQIDISMQDAAAWLTQWCWRDRPLEPEARMLPCRDGYVAALAAPEDVVAAAANLSRTELVARLSERGIAAAPVLSVAEVAESAQTRARALLVHAADATGQDWPLLSCPVRLSATPARVERPIGQLGEANEPILARLAPAVVPAPSNRP